MNGYDKEKKNLNNQKDAASTLMNMMSGKKGKKHDNKEELA